MHRSGYRLAYASALSWALFALPANADEPAPLQATLTCDRAAEPGRVRCSVEARVAEGRTIAWGDVAVLQLPDFAAALKGRIGPGDATAREGATTKFAFGLVAKKAGQGEARVRVRVVACEGAAEAPKCTPLMVEVRGTLSVGS